MNHTLVLSHSREYNVEKIHQAHHSKAITLKHKVKALLKFFTEYKHSEVSN